MKTPNYHKAYDEFWKLVDSDQFPDLTKEQQDKLAVVAREIAKGFALDIQRDTNHSVEVFIKRN